MNKKAVPQKTESVWQRHQGGLAGAVLMLAGLFVLFVARDRLQLYSRLFFDSYIWWDRPIEPWRVEKLHMLVVYSGLASLAAGGLSFILSYARPAVFTTLRDIVLAPLVLKDASGQRRLNWIAVLLLVLSPTLAIVFNLESVAAQEWLIEEDGISENVTALGFLAGAVLVSIAAYRLRVWGSTHRWVQVFFVVAAATFFFAGMEEISWGQRVFGLETPDFLVGRNFKGELNAHNVTFLKPLINRLFLIVAAIGVLGSGLLIGLDAAGRTTKDAALLLPQPALIIPFFAVAVLMLLPDKIIDFPTVQAVAEAREVLAALAAFLYSLDRLRLMGLLPRLPLQQT